MELKIFEIRIGKLKKLYGRRISFKESRNAKAHFLRQGKYSFTTKTQVTVKEIYDGEHLTADQKK